MAKEQSDQTRLENFSLQELQEHGISHFAEIPYRIEVARNLAKHTGTQRLIMYSDVMHAVPEPQRPLLFGLPGYERHPLATLIHSAGFPEGGIAFVSAPPNPVELTNLKAEKAKLERALSREVKFRVIFPIDGHIIDLLQYPKDQYKKLCLEYASWLNNPQNARVFDLQYHTLQIKEHLREMTKNQPTFILPFQTVAFHHQVFQEEKSSGTVVLPSIPDLDKAYNSFLLQEAGLESAQAMIAVGSDGRHFTDSQSYNNYRKQMSGVSFNAKPDLKVSFATGLINAIDRFALKNLGSFIKLDVNGVSGLGNLHPQSYPELYDRRIDRDVRIQKMMQVVQEKVGGQLPIAAGVEEFAKTKKLQGVSMDTTIGGFTVDGKFLPMSAFPFGTDADGVYTHGWISSKAEDVSEESGDWAIMFNTAIEMTDVRSRFGYSTGITAEDMFTLVNNNRIVIHDFNDRQGGRTYVEAFIALHDGGWVENEVKIPVHIPLSNVQMYEAYTRVCTQIMEFGSFPFSTSFGYFGLTDDGHRYMKFKILTPIDQYAQMGLPLPRNTHHNTTVKTVTALVNENIQNV